MKIITNINTDNAAFEDNENELQDILKIAAWKIAIGKKSFSLIDSNGNECGKVEVQP